MRQPIPREGSRIRLKTDCQFVETKRWQWSSQLSRSRQRQKMFDWTEMDRSRVRALESWLQLQIRTSSVLTAAARSDSFSFLKALPHTRCRRGGVQTTAIVRISFPSLISPTAMAPLVSGLVWQQAIATVSFLQGQVLMQSTLMAVFFPSAQANMFG